MCIRDRSGGGGISSSSGVTVASSATFDISGITSFTDITTLAGSGTVQVGANGLVVTNASTEFSGVIADSSLGGGIQVDAGTLTLSGTSTYSGPTFVNEGATLALKDSGSIANSTVVLTSGLTPGTQATLDISQTTSGTAIGGLLDFAPGGLVSLGSKTLTNHSGCRARRRHPGRRHRRGAAVAS